MGRIGEPEDMAGMPIDLTSRAAAYLPGSVIAVDAGMASTLRCRCCLALGARVAMR